MRSTPPSGSTALRDPPTGTVDLAAQRTTLQARIEKQIVAVSMLVPGGRRHHLATSLLLTLQDSLYLLTEIETLADALHRFDPDGAEGKGP